LQLDVFLRPELSYEVLKSHAQWLELGDMRLRILSPTKLLKLKKGIQPQRPKDLLDIAVLESKIKKS